MEQEEGGDIFKETQIVVISFFFVCFGLFLRICAFVVHAASLCLKVSAAEIVSSVEISKIVIYDDKKIAGFLLEGSAAKIY